MPSEQKPIIALPAAFILDTNILDALPETLESGELNNLMAEATQIGSRVFLPDVGAREWIKHRMDRATESLLAVKKSSTHLHQYSNAFPNPSVDTNVLIDTVLKTTTNRIKSVGFRICRPPKVNIRNITANAVCQISPFSYANKGFKDELVVLSSLEIVQRWRFKTCVLVTGDTDFSEKDIQKRFEATRVSFRIVKNIQQATELIINTLNEAGQKYFENVIRKATEYAQTNFEEISNRIIEKVNTDGMSESRLTYSSGEKFSSLDGTLKRVVNVKPVKVTGAIPGISDESTGTTPITISVDVEVDLEYERMQLDWSEIFGRRVKTVEEKKEFTFTPYKRVIITKTVSVGVEAKARHQNEKWEDFKIIEVGI